MCKTFDHQKHSAKSNKIHGTIENSLMKIFFCCINKAGVTSAMHFFSSMNHDRALPLYSPYVENGHLSLLLLAKEKQRSGAGDHGLGVEHRSIGSYRFITSLPLQQGALRYHDFHKLLIVRHPLQRLVSAYFQFLRHQFKSDSFRDFVK